MTPTPEDGMTIEEFEAMFLPTWHAAASRLQRDDGEPVRLPVGAWLDMLRLTARASGFADSEASA